MSEDIKQADGKEELEKGDGSAKASDDKVNDGGKKESEGTTEDSKAAEKAGTEGTEPEAGQAPDDGVEAEEALAEPDPDAETPEQEIRIIRAEGSGEGGDDDEIDSIVMIDGEVLKTDQLTEQDIKNLEKRRDKLNAKAEDYKHRRDRLNDRTKELIRSREKLNNRIKKLVKEASDCKEERNTLNVQVKEAKVLRETLNKRANELSEKVNKLKKERLPKDEGPSIGRLRKDLRDLEFKQQTSSLSRQAERELVEKMKALSDDIKEREKKLEANEDVRQAVRDSRKARQDAEAQHKLVGDLADRAQKQHDRMVELYSESDSLRKELNLIHEQLVETKSKADEEHKMHITLIRQVHDFDKLIFGMRRKIRKAKKARGETDVKKQQKEIMDKFKKGEKLSTEDLLALQNK